jgi:ADP-heptose:LPS heptosyltransferase
MPITSKHILISRTDNIGDIVLTLPMAARLKELNPGVRISMLCRRYAADVVRYCDDIDDVVEEENVADDLYGFLRASDIDTVILAQPNRDLAKAAFLRRVKHRIGNARQKVYQLIYCNDRVRFSKGCPENHESQINFEFLRPYGDSHIPTREEIPDLYHFSIPVDAGIAAVCPTVQPDPAHQVQWPRPRVAGGALHGTGTHTATASRAAYLAHRQRRRRKVAGAACRRPAGPAA